MPIYKVSEDTLLLADVVKELEGNIIVDVGSGNGYIAKTVAEKFQWVIATDINYDAICYIRNKLKSYPNIDIIQCDLFDAIRNIEIDYIVFNPPYLPNDDIKTDLDNLTVYINYNGKNIIEEFLSKLINFKNVKETFLVISSLTNIEEILGKDIKKSIRLEKIKSIRRFFEEIIVYKVSIITF